LKKKMRGGGGDPKEQIIYLTLGEQKTLRTFVFEKQQLGGKKIWKKRPVEKLVFGKDKKKKKEKKKRRFFSGTISDQKGPKNKTVVGGREERGAEPRQMGSEEKFQNLSEGEGCHRFVMTT